MRKKLQQGFTLIELLVVIAIIGILATTALTQLGSARGRARDAKRLSDIAQIAQAIEIHNDQVGGYPDDIYTDLINYISGTTVPIDPSTDGEYNYLYRGGSAGKRTAYHLWAELESNNRALNSDADINSREVLTPAWTVGSGAAEDGAAETCTNSSSIDCVYDIGQK
ncbi:MAG: type II secretion system protein [Candidatus Paceibacterota bacterium]|nr:MAG: type II secretion system protein [Candidatus Paceibacterota bacterium]